MKTIPLTKNKVCLVDDCDFDWISQLAWRATITCPSGIERWYAIHTFYPSGITVYMHREIMIRRGHSPENLFDHKDGDGLNNQGFNLRPCSAAQNVQNRRKQPGLSSRCKGVYWHRRDRKWMARLQHQGKNKFLGYFQDEEQAGKAYDAAALEYFGEFAKLNFP